MNIKKISAVLMAAVVALTASACGKKDNEQSQEQSDATNVTVYEVGTGDINATASYTGEITAAESTVVSGKVSGEAKSVNVKEGDFVKAGSVLMTIDTTSYQLAYNQALAAYNSAISAKKSAEASKRSAEAGYNSVTGGSNAQTLSQLETALNSAKIAYDNALDNYNKQKTLYDMGAISEIEFNTYKTAYENAQLSLNSAQTNYDLTKNVVSGESAANAQAAIDVAEAGIGSAVSGIESAKAALDIARNNLDNCNVKAPISGYISSKSISKGQMAAQGVGLFTITNTSTVEAKINVTEAVIEMIDVGTAASVSIKSAGIDSVGGTVTAVNPVKDTATGLFSVRVSVPNDAGDIKVGMIADIVLVTQSGTDTITVPTASLLQEGDSYYVYVAEGDTAVRRDVTLGITNDDTAEIISGVNSGDKVIVSGKEYLSDKNNAINIVAE